MSTDEIDPQLLTRAQRMAERLRLDLNRQFSDGGDSLNVLRINFPEEAALILRWSLWTCEVDDGDETSTSPISRYLRPSQLYFLFRCAFAGLDAPLDHPNLQLCPDRQDLLAGRGSNFVSSRRTIEVKQGSSVFVCPRHLVADQSPWGDVELCVQGWRESGVMVACNVNPFDFGQPKGVVDAGNYQLADPGELPTLYVLIQEGDIVLYSPVARLVAVDQDNGTATFELDYLVEEFSIEAN